MFWKGAESHNIYRKSVKIFIDKKIKPKEWHIISIKNSEKNPIMIVKDVNNKVIKEKTFY
jgi:hypothetical protein